MSRLSAPEQLLRGLSQLALAHDEQLVAPDFLAQIQQIPNEKLFEGNIQNSGMAQAARAGLLLIAGGWDEAHKLVQEMETPEAEYWHGIVHRREPDFSNAKYWFRKVGHHPVMDSLLRGLTRQNYPHSTVVQQLINNGKWDPFQYLALCSACHEGAQKELLPVLLDIQKEEIALLVNYCIQHARDGS